MTPILTAAIVAVYFIMLLVVGRLTAKKGDNESFFTANRSSPWYLVAFGMIGTSISGVTFISVPGEVGANSFYYLQFVAGNFLGYLIIIRFLLPLYYRLNLTSIYSYLEGRYGPKTHKAGAFFFLLSRTIGAAARLYLVALVFQIFIFDNWGFPFWLSVILSVGLILAYSIKGGVKTIIWTDTLQTVFLVAALIMTIIFLNHHLGFSTAGAVSYITHSNFSKVFSWDYNSKTFFIKQFLSGIFITVAMTGLDQDLMQKNLTCKNLKDAQKNMFVFSFIFIAVVLMFLSLGALLYTYAAKNGIAIPAKTDQLFPTLALHYFPALFSFVFIIGLTAAAFASADSALTALTTSFCIDFLKMNENSGGSLRKRYYVHIMFSLLIILCIYIFNYYNNQSIISAIFKIAGYTYGPLLGLYSFGLFSKRVAKDEAVTVICFLSPLVTYALELVIHNIFPNYNIGFETLVVNAGLIHIILSIISRRKISSEPFHSLV
jgi:SSS family solute:Na+ symporter